MVFPTGRSEMRIGRIDAAELHTFARRGHHLGDRIPPDLVMRRFLVGCGSLPGAIGLDQHEPRRIIRLLKTSNRAIPGSSRLRCAFLTVAARKLGLVNSIGRDGNPEVTRTGAWTPGNGRVDVDTFEMREALRISQASCGLVSTQRQPSNLTPYSDFQPT